MATLLASAARTESGTQVLTGVDAGQWQSGVFELTVTAAATDAGDTLNIYLQHSVDGGSTWDDFVSFDQVIGTATPPVSYLATWDAYDVATTTHAKSDGTLAAGTIVNGPKGPRWRVKWVVVDAGTDNASFTFKIDAHMTVRSLRPAAVGLYNADPGGGNLLKVAPAGDAGTSTSTGGAVNITNTGSVGAGLVVYSNQDADASGRLVNIRADNAAFDQAALHVDYDGTANAVEIASDPAAGAGDASSIALNVTSTNPLDTTIGVSGYEEGKGTIKVTHNKPANADTNASAISLLLKGSGTAAQGIFLDTDTGIATTGKLINLRNQQEELFVVDANGRALITTPDSAPTDGDLNQSMISFYLDEAGSKLKVRVKYANGTTLKTGEIALA